MLVHTVEFLSPGTFVSETSEFDMREWNVKSACEMAKNIKERYSSRPYGFRFRTYLTQPEVSDGEGGLLKVERRLKKSSGLHVLGGRIIKHEDVPKHLDGILKDNMRWNDHPVIFENTNSWRFTYFFEAEDKIVDPETGSILISGDDPELVAYRAKKIAEWKNERPTH